MTTRRRPLLTALIAAVAWWLAAAGPAGAHTVADVVAVPAGAQATASLQPGHGCGTSPTVAVSIRAPVRGATAGEVDGWTATAVEDEDGTVLEWTGGVLPSDQTGRFPVTFTAPDAVGQLLLFPAVQVCEDGGELAWISGDPTAEYPAPRVLVLPAGAAAAATIDDVPPDAPGRDQLSEIVDVDADQGDEAASDGDGTTTTTDPAGSDGSATADDGGDATAGSGEPGAEGGGDAAADPDAAEEGDDSSDGVGAVGILVAVVVAAAVVAGIVVVLRRGRSPGPR